MIIWREGVVTARGTSWRGAQELRVQVTGGGGDSPAGGAAVAPGASLKALAYPTLVGEPDVGDRVLLNVSALARGLGTGGYALVIAVPDRLPADPPQGPGHLVKGRYTPEQVMVLGVDEQESPEHELLREADSLEGMPVVVADLHSALPAVIAGARAEAQAAGREMPRIVYLMTDGGALPAWFSRAVAGLTDAGWLTATITVGQAFGGDLEAVTLHTGLLAARHVVGADLAIVAQGPGNLGTGTRWGFSGVAAGEAINAVATLGGRPIASLRVSGADPRGRHRGVSHHSTTAYGRVALAGADVVVPVTHDGEEPGYPADLAAGVGATAELLAARPGTVTGRLHRYVGVSTAGLRAALETSPVRLSTMGRSLEVDASPFLAAAAAGVWAQRLTAPVTGRIRHLALLEDWEAAQATGAYTVSTRGQDVGEVGFIHASHPGQVDAIRERFYADLPDEALVVLGADAATLNDRGLVVVNEPGDPADPAGERFPHVYAELPLDVLTAGPYSASGAVP